MFKIPSEVIGMANGISFEYNFGFPHSTPLVRSYELFKTIKEEYVIISWMSFWAMLEELWECSEDSRSSLPQSGQSMLDYRFGKGASFFEWCTDCAQLFPSVLFSFVDTHPTGSTLHPSLRYQFLKVYLFWKHCLSMNPNCKYIQISPGSKQQHPRSSSTPSLIASTSLCWQ